ncbi:MAG: hypothetical protein JWO65_2227 [Sphingomonas bacterium]|jgi:hypothetical protein|nr:hypothetical protein [Sphingomonas bacterium]
MSRVERKASGFDQAGVVAATGGLALVLAGAMRIISPLPPPSGRELLVAGALAIGMIVLLCRFAMPGKVRAPLIGGLILILLLLTLMGDPFGLKATNRKVSAVLDKAATDQAEAARDVAGDGGGPPTRMPGGGAQVRLDPAAGGDGGWAGRIDTALDGRIGTPNAGMIAVTGDVTARGEGFAVAWSIMAGGEPVRCGTTSVMEGGYPIDQLAASFGKAVERSIRAGKAVCY